MTASTYYTKAFCVRCLKDCARLGGKWRNRMFFCALCVAGGATNQPKDPK
mgnify:CR=1 FL=1